MSRPVPIKLFTVWLGACLLALILASSAHAQLLMPQVPGFSSDYPWFNNVSQYQGDQSFRYFLANHPNIAQALARNPRLLYDANWRSQFPALEQYLANHPYEWQALNARNWAEGPAETPWGGYDSQHQWRDAYWWHQNDPSWFYDNHQDWASLDSRWRSQDGAYDNQHQWHYGEWWYNQDPNWVARNHPNWVAEHRNWENQTEQRTYRQQHAMATAIQPQQTRTANPRPADLQQQQNSRNQRQQQATLEQNQQNHQRAAEQHQTSLNRQQQTHQVNQQRQQATRVQDQNRARAQHGPAQTPHRPTEVAVPQRDQHQPATRQQHPTHEQQNQHDPKAAK